MDTAGLQAGESVPGSGTCLVAPEPPLVVPASGKLGTPLARKATGQLEQLRLLLR